ncbi:MAG: hypothetical protein LBK03_07685 [Bacteroidales bacterium]|jgi:hypothetical protein|nr:hypothetical protein [Bacteroidales bacterium]
MDLEELKQSWKTASENLPQHAFNKTYIKKLITSKSSSSIRKLVNWDFFSLIIVILLIPAMVWLNGAIENQFPHLGLPALITGRIFYVFMYVLLSLITVWYIVKLRFLMRLDTSKNLMYNQICIAKYSLMNKIEKIATIIITVILTALGVSIYAILKAPLLLWIFFTCIIFTGILVSIYMYKMVYSKHIASIQENLQELKELENDEA